MIDLAFLCTPQLRACFPHAFHSLGQWRARQQPPAGESSAAFALPLTMVVFTAGFIGPMLWGGHRFV
jgi:hypothetical protein